MKTAAHQYEDKLLEFAYGELARPEAEAVEAHVRTCNKCSEALAEIRGVRATMAQLPMVAAPDAGLDSLLAYAEQAAKRNAEKAPVSIWRRFLAPVVTVMALLTVGVVGLRAKDEFDTNPASVAADQKVADKERADLAKKNEPAAPVAQAETAKQPTEKDEAEGGAKATEKKELRGQALDGLTQESPPVVAAVSPTPEKPADAPDLPVWDTAAYNKKGAKTSAPQKTAPLSKTRRSISNEETATKDAADDANLKNALGDVSTKGGKAQTLPDYMNSGAGFRDAQGKAADEKKSDELQAAKKEKADEKRKVAETEAPPKADKAPMPPPPPAPKTAPVEQKQVWAQSPPKEAPPSNGPAFGLGSSAPSGTTSSLSGGLNTGGATGPGAAREEAKPAPKQPAKDAYRGSYDPAPAPAATAPAPVVSSAPSTPSVAPRKSMSFPGLSTGSSGASGRGAGDDEDTLALQNADNRSLNEDARLAANQRAQASTLALEQARVASNSGDRAQEIELAKKSLGLGTQGAQRAEALKRLCDAYDFLGEPEQADPYCRALLNEFPGSISARQVSDRRNRAAPSAKKPVRAKEDRRAVDLESVDKPEPSKASPTTTGEAF